MMRSDFLRSFAPCRRAVRSLPLKMKKQLTSISILMLTILLASCSNVKLNGHFHLECVNDNTQFQVWNIKNNRMVINREVCKSGEEDCFSSQIKFTGGKIMVEPWVDIDYEADYEIDDKGIITMKNERNILKLVPHFNCVSNLDYFQNKTQTDPDTFQLVQESMTGNSRLPSSYENELIVTYANAESKSELILNSKYINSIDEIPKSNGKSIWLHIDKRVTLKQIAPIIADLNEKGFKQYFSALSIRENNEEIQLLSRNIKSISKEKEKYQIEICEFCEKYPINQIDSILKIEVLGLEKYYIQSDTVDLFQTRNKIVRYLGKSRTSRLNTQIQFEFSDNLSYENYFRLMDEINFVHIELSEIMNYKGKEDEDMEDIRNGKLDKKKEFPIRIKEVIKRKTAENK